VYNAPVHVITDWAQAIPAWLAVVLLTLVPALELRASIPYGLLATSLPAWQVILLAILANWLVAPLVYTVLQLLLKLCLRWPWFAKRWERYSGHVLRKIHASVESWGSWGLAIFIGIPLPGTGVYTGAVGAYLLGMSMRRFLVVSLAGVLLAGAIVTIVVLSGSQAFAWLAKPLAQP
jgi:uncharacterized membrane protein